MNAQDMLDYTFGLLDEPRRVRFEHAMNEDPDLRLKVSRLGNAVASMVDDGEENEPPHDLAARTLALVARRRQKPTFQDYLPSRVPFRLADAAVAAVVFFAAIATLTGPIMRSRANVDQAACALNLHRLGVGLSKYAATHGSFPFVPDKYPAGTYGVMLKDASDLPDPSILSCPCATRAKHSGGALPSMKSLDDLARKSPTTCQSLMDGHYAYHIGYRPSLHTQPEPVPNAASAFVPIAGDGPPHDDCEIRDGNSPNHAGIGQNVLFCDGHVAWKRTRWMSNEDKDLFRNEADRPSHGLHPTDSVLVPSAMPVSYR